MCDRNTLPINVFFSILLNPKCSQWQYAAKLCSTSLKYICKAYEYNKKPKNKQNTFFFFWLKKRLVFLSYNANQYLASLWYGIYLFLMKSLNEGLLSALIFGSSYLYELVQISALFLLLSLCTLLSFTKRDEVIKYTKETNVTGS